MHLNIYIFCVSFFLLLFGQCKCENTNDNNYDYSYYLTDPYDDMEEEWFNDPYESFNRKVFKFNTIVDKAVIKPFAEIYKAITPPIIQDKANNFFSNLQEPLYVLHGLLTLDFRKTFTSFSRFMINSTVGVGGFSGCCNTS